MLNDFNLEGKTALVTGASRGIGKEIALVLAEAGADVAIAARRLDRIEQTADELRAFGRRAVPIQTDVSDSQQVDDMVAHATESLGRMTSWSTTQESPQAAPWCLSLEMMTLQKRPREWTIRHGSPLSIQI